MSATRGRCADRRCRRTVNVEARCDSDPPHSGLAGLTEKGPAIHFAEHGADESFILNVQYEDVDGLTRMSGVAALVPVRARRPTLDRGHSSSRAIVALALAITLLSGACRSSGDDDIVEPPTTDFSTTTSVPSSTSTSPTSTSSTPEGDPGESADAVDSYLAFWTARFQANAGTPNPDDPALAEFATGPQLDNVVAETQRRLDAGLALREAEPSQTTHDVKVVSVDDDRVELQDCFVNDGVVYDIETGDVVDDSVVTRSVSADMVRVDGTWKLERATVVQEWEGIAGCALAS